MAEKSTRKEIRIFDVDPTTPVLSASFVGPTLFLPDGVLFVETDGIAVFMAHVMSLVKNTVYYGDTLDRHLLAGDIRGLFVPLKSLYAAGYRLNLRVNGGQTGTISFNGNKKRHRLASFQLTTREKHQAEYEQYLLRASQNPGLVMQARIRELYEAIPVEDGSDFLFRLWSESSFLRVA